jgi:hypothetical protein
MSTALATRFVPWRADIGRYFASAGRMSNQHGVLQIQLIHRYSSKGALINKSTAEIGL